MKIKTLFWPTNTTAAAQDWLQARRSSPLTLLGVVCIALYGFWPLSPEPNVAILDSGARSGKIIYVKAGSEGNGKSWDKAFGDLQEALEVAKKNDQIWVAEGEYRPTNSEDRSISFVLVEAVALLGGFAGTETSLEERDMVNHPTILSGDIGTSLDKDNSHTVVFAENITELTLVEGFTIRGGQSDGTATKAHKNSCGAAWFNLNASPTIRHCRFERNNAREGGAIYNLAGKNGNASPHISHCVFVGNQADLDGGCLFNNGDEGICKPRIENCKFENNIATYGSGMMNRARYGMTLVQVKACEFYKNKALEKGSVIYNHRDKTGICTTKLQDCVFTGNYTTEGPELDASYDGNPDIVGNE